MSFFLFMKHIVFEHYSFEKKQGIPTQPVRHYSNEDNDKMEWKPFQSKGKYAPEVRNSHQTIALGNKYYLHGGRGNSTSLGDMNCLDLGKLFCTSTYIEPT